MSFLEEAHAFVTRESVGVPLSPACVQLLFDAVDVFEEEVPEWRDLTDHAFRGTKGFWSFDLLGFIAATAGMDLTSLPPNAQSIPVREYLSQLGFTYYDQLCLDEISKRSPNDEVLRQRVLRFATTGERMPSP